LAPRGGTWSHRGATACPGGGFRAAGKTGPAAPTLAGRRKDWRRVVRDRPVDGLASPGAASDPEDPPGAKSGERSRLGLALVREPLRSLRLCGKPLPFLPETP